jgi:DNA-binding MarR family transcriptional regulator
LLMESNVAALGTADTIGQRSPGRLLRRINKLLQKRIHERLAEADNDRPFEEWMALKLVSEGMVETPGDLAREFGIGTGAATRLTDNLEQQGLIERDRIREDRRVVLLKLTALGKKRYISSVPTMVSCWNDLLRDFSRDEVSQLVTLLTKLEAAFEPCLD